MEIPVQPHPSETATFGGKKPPSLFFGGGLVGIWSLGMSYTHDSHRKKILEFFPYGHTQVVSFDKGEKHLNKADTFCN